MRCVHGILRIDHARLYVFHSQKDGSSVKTTFGKSQSIFFAAYLKRESICLSLVFAINDILHFVVIKLTEISKKYCARHSGTEGFFLNIRTIALPLALLVNRFIIFLSLH